MTYIPWSIVKLLHEERVNEALRIGRVNKALPAAKPTRRFRFFETKKNSRQPSTKRPVNELR